MGEPDTSSTHSTKGSLNYELYAKQEIELYSFLQRAKDVLYGSEVISTPDSF